MMMLNHFANPQAAWLLLLPLVVYFMFPAIKKNVWRCVESTVFGGY